MMLKKTVILLLFVSGILFAQVFESGLGSSALIELKKGGADINFDNIPDFSSATIYGRKTINSGANQLEEIYSLQEISSDYFPVAHTEVDLNGDGIDEFVVASHPPAVSNGPVEILLSVRQGDNGKTVFRKSFSSYLINDKQAVYLSSADLYGDGIDELLILTKKNEQIAGVNLIRYYGYVLDIEGNIIKEIAVPALAGQSARNLIIQIADFNGDQRDDIFLIQEYVTESVTNSKYLDLLLIEGISGNPKNVTPQFLKENPVNFYKTICGNFSSYPRDNALILFKTGSSLLDDYSIITMDFYTGYVKNEKIATLFPDLQNYHPDIIKIGTFSESFVESLIISFRCGEDFDLDGNPDRFFFTAFNPVSNNVIFSDYGAPYGPYFYTNYFFVADLNGNKKDDIFQIFRGGADSDGDNIGDEIYTRLIRDDGTTIYTKPIGQLGITNITPGSEIISATQGWFDGDNYTDIALLFLTKNKIADETIQKKYTLGIISPTYRSLIMSKSYLTSNIELENTIITLNNNISDRQFLKQLDLSPSTLKSTRQKFLERNYQGAVLSFYHYYMKQRPTPVNYSSQEYYFIAHNDEMSFRIKKFSTASTMEIPGFQSFSNIYNEPSAGAMRLGRISSSFAERVYKQKEIDTQTFLFSLKSILSHMRWLDREENFTPEYNHGIIFELAEYGRALGHLNNFKQFNISSDYSFQKAFSKRMQGQLNHISDDGIYDEHSITYAFLAANTLDYLSDYFIKNSFFKIEENLVKDMLFKAKQQFGYFLYAVKPLEISTNDILMQIRPDIPVIGDSESKIVRKWFGKSSSDNNSSILNEPLVTGRVDNWNDPLLKSHLIFAASGNGELNGSPPAQISKFFAKGGYFVSRSNWIQNSSDNEYDHNARYLHLKAGELVPTNGIYDGFTTNSGHGHADLLSVDMVAYNKNLVVDPGGYVTTSMNNLLEQFNPQYFTELYNYPAPDNKFDMVRSYFKGTAAHNTVYINKGQIEYKNNWRWFDLKSVSSHSTDYFIGTDFDYIRAGYSRIDTRGEYSHTRNMLYVKPGSSDGVNNDYWVIIDKLDFSAYSGNNNAEQIWHISPEQKNISIAHDGKFTGDNFIMEPVSFGDDYRISSSLIPGYTMTYLSLNNSSIVKYRAEITTDNFIYVTIIFPFSDERQISGFEVNSFPIYNSAGSTISPYDGFGLTVKLKTHSGDQLLDYLTFSQEGQEYMWEMPYSGYTINSQKIAELHRFLNGKPHITTGISPDSIITSLLRTHPESFELDQNFPNPFNPSTNIGFRIKVPGKYKLEIFDILGRRITLLLEEELGIGDYNVIWNGINSFSQKVTSGIYFYTLSSATGITTKKLVFLK